MCSAVLYQKEAVSSVRDQCSLYQPYNLVQKQTFVKRLQSLKYDGRCTHGTLYDNNIPLGLSNFNNSYNNDLLCMSGKLLFRYKQPSSARTDHSEFQ